jgi:hypothetical protein
MNETSAWLTAFTELKRQDEEMCKEYREEVDTLLVFVRDLELLLSVRSYRRDRLVSSPLR